MFKIEKTKPLYLQVYNILKKEILEKKWSPGERLIESQIATNLNLSRSPVREALRVLEYEGLIVRSDQNLYIYNPSVKDIVELYQLRFSLEALSSRLAAEAATEEELIEMKFILKMTREALDNGDVQGVYECNTRFHDAILYASKNKHLIDMMESLRSKVLFCRNTLIRTDYVRMDNFIYEHNDIFQALKERRKEDVKSLMEKHISIDLKCILNLFPNNLEGGL